MERPIVYLMRGLPGSGKSHYVEQLKKQLGEPLAVFSADFYPGRYEKPFDPKKIAGAHPWCFSGYLRLLEECKKCDAAGVSGWPGAIVVDNTNISAWELAPYILAASAFKLQHQIVTIWCDPVTAWQRNQHEVPFHVMLDMFRRLLVEQIPTFWNHKVECVQ